MKNIMSIDLEDYYCDLPFSTWPEFESRVIKNTQRLLDLFEKYNVTATFFTLGFIDCDLGESMNYAAENIWPRIVNGGWLFFHDYGWEGYSNVKHTVDNFVNKHHDEIKWHKLLKGMFYIKKQN